MRDDASLIFDLPWIIFVPMVVPVLMGNALPIIYYFADNPELRNLAGSMMPDSIITRIDEYYGRDDVLGSFTRHRSHRSLMILLCVLAYSTAAVVIWQLLTLV